MFENTSVSRRAVTKTAAWGVPAVAVVSAAPAFATSHDQTITRNLTYRVFAGLNKVATAALIPAQTAPPYTTPAGWLNQDIWDVVVTTTIPTHVAPNTSVPAPPLSVQVTTSLAAAETLITFGVSHVQGDSTPFYNIAGSVVNPGQRQAVLTVPRTAAPPPDAIAPIVTVAAGNAQAETSTTAGQITQEVANNFLANLTTEGSAFITAIGLIGAQEPAGQDRSFGTIEVG